MRTEDALKTNPSLEDAAQFQLAVTQYLAEGDHLREQISRDQIEINQSQMQTRGVLAELKTMLVQAG